MRTFASRVHIKKSIFALVALFSFTAFSEEPICSSHSENAALVVIDMQPVFITRGGNEKTPGNQAKVEQLTKEQVTAIKRAKESKIPIVFIEYAGAGDTNNSLKEALETT